MLWSSHKGSISLTQILCCQDFHPTPFFFWVGEKFLPIYQQMLFLISEWSGDLQRYSHFRSWQRKNLKACLDVVMYAMYAYIQLYRSIVINLQMYLSKVLVRPFSGTDMLSTSVTSFFKYFQHTYQCYKSLQKCWSYLDKHIIIAAMHRSEI